MVSSCSSENGKELTVESMKSSFEAFSTLMHEWEKKCYAGQMTLVASAEGGSLPVEHSKKLQEIFGAFVLDGKRNYDRIENLVCGLNPEYDPSSDTITDAGVLKKEGYLVIRKSSGLCPTYKLTFSMSDSICKIKKREFECEAGKWKATYV